MSYDKAKAAADKLRNTGDAAIDILGGEDNSVATVSPELAMLYQTDKGVGADGVTSGGVPRLRMHFEGWSKNVCQDGSTPKHGQMFYDETQEAFDEVDVHLLAVSRGYYGKPHPKASDPNKKPYTQLVFGVFAGSLDPFVYYAQGTKLGALWSSMSENVSRYTHGQNGVPLYALQMKIRGHKYEMTNGDEGFAPHFYVSQYEDGRPMIVNDIELAEILSNSQKKAMSLMERMIKSGEGEDENMNEAPHPAEVI